MQKFNYIYGPVSSWRIGCSLGVDPLSQKNKICGFDCVYCQLGRGKPFKGLRKIYVPTVNIIKELKSVPCGGIDYITISGSGEPTLAKNLGQIIRSVKSIRKEPVAVITNSALICNSSVRRELSGADLVIAKLDACSQKVFKDINRPARGINFEKVLEAIKRFKRGYKGRLALQIMFIRKNKRMAGKIAEIAREINPDEVQINTPLRKSRCKPLSRKEIAKIIKYFDGFKVVNVYECRRKRINPISISNTKKRRGE